jgi:hypothetical protein
MMPTAAITAFISLPQDKKESAGSLREPPADKGMGLLEGAHCAQTHPRVKASKPCADVPAFAEAQAQPPSQRMEQATERMK